jgi:hypothetical protein
MAMEQRLSAVCVFSIVSHLEQLLRMAKLLTRGSSREPTCSGFHSLKGDNAMIAAIYARKSTDQGRRA